MPLLMQKRKRKRGAAMMMLNVDLAASRLNHLTTISAARRSVIKALPTSSSLNLNHSSNSSSNSKNNGRRIPSVHMSTLAARGAPAFKSAIS